MASIIESGFCGFRDHSQNLFWVKAEELKKLSNFIYDAILINLIIFGNW